jgi:hypothetical protein
VIASAHFLDQPVTNGSELAHHNRISNGSSLSILGKITMMCSDSTSPLQARAAFP